VLVDSGSPGAVSTNIYSCTKACCIACIQQQHAW
jgi:hypothetical protein